MSDVLKSSGIRRPYDDLERLQKMIDGADITVTAWDGDTLVGVARALTDWSYCCYLSDLAVRRDYQKRGIGEQLVRVLRENLTDQVNLVLLSSPESLNFYPKIGFEKADNCFFIRRER